MRHGHLMLSRGAREGHAPQGSLMIELRALGDGNAVAVCNDLAGRDPRSVRDRRGQVLVGDPLRDNLLDSSACSDVSKRPIRAENAVAGFDQVVAGEAGELAELMDELVVDLAGDLIRAGHVDTLVRRAD
jgi:hypothetical protein